MKNKPPYLQYILFVVVFSFLHILEKYLDFDYNHHFLMPGEIPPAHPFLYYLIPYIQTITLWVFIGVRISKLKEGIITGLILISSQYFINFILPIFPLIAFILFSYLIFDTKKDRIKGALLFPVILIGSSFLYFSHDFFDSINEIPKFFGFGRGYYDDWFSLYVPLEEPDSFRKYNLLYEIIMIMQYILQYILVVKVYYFIKFKKSFSLNEINISNTYSKLKTTILVYILYISIIVISINLIYYVNSFLNIHLLSRQNSIYAIPNLIINILFQIFFILILSWFYRKILLKFFISHNQNISWRYYLAQIPIIGSIIWLINLFVFEKASNLTEKQIDKIKSKENTGIILLMVFFTVLSAFPILNDAVIPTALFALLNFCLLIFYIVKKEGLYVLIALQFLLFFVVFFTDYLEEYNFKQTITQTYFLYIAIAIINYPLFHIKQFKITGIIVSEPEEFEELEVE